MLRLTIILLLAFCTHTLLAQETATIAGNITDENGDPMLGVSIYVEELIGIDGGVASFENGDYKIIVPANEHFTLIFYFTGYEEQKITGVFLEPEEIRKIDIQMGAGVETKTVVVSSWDDKEADAQRIEAEDIVEIPTTTMNLESVLQFVAVGVSAGTGGELTSQYSVRGGNYDENLIYVNGFEIYRPLLIRSGQQEGLTFPNPDMLSHLSFSSGGFKAEYGDKMASVLDVRYKRPTESFEGAVGGSLLGGSVYLGGAIYRDSTAKARKSPYRTTYTFGTRYKTTQYLLGGLDIEGQYISNFIDVQGNIIHDFSPKLQLEVLGNYNNAIYTLTPFSGETVSGLFNQALRLTTLFDGKELSNFENFFVGTALKFEPKRLAPIVEDEPINRTRYRLLASHYQSYENERIDIKGFYRLDEIETGLGEDDFGEVIGTLAYGETHQFARNFLTAKVTQVRFLGDWIHESYDKEKDRKKENFFKWGLGYKNEIIDDQLKEWTRFDSLGYTLPYDTTALSIEEYYKTDAALNSHRFTAFVQNTWDLKTPKNHWRTTLGVRTQYWTLNQELLISPRAELYYTPRKYINPMSDTTTKTKDLTFKLAAGAYYQPPFYRELRDLNGNVNTDVKAQKSIHALGGVVWDFVMFNRPFKFITEGYYKHQWDLVPYDVDNVRIRYYGENSMRGYVTGLDLRLNGELVDGMESWVNLSLLRARESINGVQHRVRRFVDSQIDTFDLADVPKPTDQFMIFSMYFQDYLPKTPWCKVNLAFTVGSGLPFGIPKDNIEYRNTYRYSPYHRIDIGFSFAVWNRKQYIKNQCGNNPEVFQTEHRHFFKKVRNVWFSLEVFNLTNNKNVSSNTWVKDFTNRSYAIPNRLTSLRVNARFRVDF